MVTIHTGGLSVVSYEAKTVLMRYIGDHKFISRKGLPEYTIKCDTHHCVDVGLHDLMALAEHFKVVGVAFDCVLW